MAISAKLGICFLGFLLASSTVFAQTLAETTIERIDIRGNRRIPEETIRFYIQSRPGEPIAKNAWNLTCVLFTRLISSKTSKSRSGTGMRARSSCLS